MSVEEQLKKQAFDEASGVLGGTAPEKVVSLEDALDAIKQARKEEREKLKKELVKGVLSEIIAVAVRERDEHWGNKISERIYKVLKKPKIFSELENFKESKKVAEK